MTYSESWSNAGFPDALKYRNILVYRAILKALQECSEIMNVSFDAAAMYAGNNFAAHIKSQMQRIYQSILCFKPDESVSFADFFHTYHPQENGKFGCLYKAGFLKNFPQSLNCLSEKIIYTSDTGTTFQKHTKTLSFSYEKEDTDPFTMQEICSRILADYRTVPATTENWNNRTVRTNHTMDFTVSRTAGGKDRVYGVVESEKITANMTDSKNCQCRSYSSAYKNPQNTSIGLVYTLNHESPLSAGNTVSVDFSGESWADALPFSLNEQDMSAGSFEVHRTKTEAGIFTKKYTGQF